jgi:hypothetical protein
METCMSNRLRNTVLAAVLGTSCALAAAPALADWGVSFNTGDVAFAYRDGYWDHYHHWHHWRDPDQVRWYRTHYSNNYYDYDHDRDSGWHDRGYHRGWYHHDDWRDRYNHDDHDRYYNNNYNNYDNDRDRY